MLAEVLRLHSDVDVALMHKEPGYTLFRKVVSENSMNV